MDEISEIHRSLGRIESTLTSIKENMDRGGDRLDDHAGRIGKIERKQKWYAGLAAGIGAALGIGSSHWPKLAIAFVALGAALALPNPAQAADPNLCAQNLPYGLPSLPSHLRTTLICYPGYAAMHDADKLIPRWVAYRVRGPNTLGCVARRNNFHAEPALPKNRRATPADYARSGYDMGHMAAGQDFAWDKDRLSESFSLANMAPQLPGLNRQQWLRLEESVRAWAWARGELMVYVGPLVDDYPRTIGRNRVAVPRAFGKVVIDPATSEALAFAMPQQAIPKGPLAPWQFPISDVERTAQMAIPLPSGVERMQASALWAADLRGWNRAHKAACKR